MNLKIDEIISFLYNNQEKNGEFKSFCYLPYADKPTWYYTGPSPFVTANILYCLQHNQSEISKKIIEKGIKFLLNKKEKFNLWRYWQHNSPIMEYNVPNDLDDTCLSSFVIEKNTNININNKNTILENKNKNASFNTWFLPRFIHLKNPSKFYYFTKELILTRKVFLPNKKIPNNENISSINDNESTVDATVLLYMHKYFKPKKTIELIKNEIINNKLRLQYYDQNCFAYYHLSRVYYETNFYIDDIKNAILKNIDKIKLSYNYDENYLTLIISLLTLINFNWVNNEIYFKLKKHLLADNMLLNQEWKPFKYWTSKQRSWWAGSKELTAALYLEALLKIK